MAWQWLRIGFAAASFAGFGVGALLLSVVVLPVVSLCTWSRERRVRRCQRLVQVSFRVFHAFMRRVGLVDWDPARCHARLPEQPVVVVANHPTLVDITALVSLFGPICFLAKRALFRNPLVGPLLYWCNQIPGGGNTLHENMQVIEAALDRLARGHSVLLFPEGTRSPPGGMLRFHAGAFEIARRAGVPIIPVVMQAEPAGLYRGLAWYQIPSRTIRLRAHVLPALEPNARGDGDARSIRAQVEDAIRARLS